MLILHVTSSRFCLYLPNIHHFTYTFSHARHTQAHIYNQHIRGMATTRHKGLVEGGGRKALLETLHTHTKKRKTGKKCQEKPIFTNLKKRFRHIELSVKLLDYFLRSNKSNINQSITHIHFHTLTHTHARTPSLSHTHTLSLTLTNPPIHAYARTHTLIHTRKQKLKKSRTHIYMNLSYIDP